MTPCRFIDNYQHLERTPGIYLPGFFCLLVFGATTPQWAMASSFTRFLDHTQRRNTVGRTPLDEWSALRRDLYLTTHNAHNWPKSIKSKTFGSSDTFISDYQYIRRHAEIRQAMYYECNTEARSRNPRYRANARSVTSYSYSCSCVTRQLTQQNQLTLHYTTLHHTKINPYLANVENWVSSD